MSSWMNLWKNMFGSVDTITMYAQQSLIALAMANALQFYYS